MVAVAVVGPVLTAGVAWGFGQARLTALEDRVTVLELRSATLAEKVANNRISDAQLVEQVGSIRAGIDEIRRLLTQDRDQ